MSQLIGFYMYRIVEQRRLGGEPAQMRKLPKAFVVTIQNVWM